MNPPVPGLFTHKKNAEAIPVTPLPPPITEKTFTFANGNSAHAVYAQRKSDPRAIFNALHIQSPKTLIVLAAGKQTLDPVVHSPLTQLFSRGLLRAAGEISTAILTQAYNAGVIRILGRCVAERDAYAHIPLIGFAAASDVALPENSDNKELTALEPHHSHFVIVENRETFDEIELMFSLVHLLTKEIPIVTLLIHGDESACLQVLRAVRLKMPVVVLEGSGGLADEIATLYHQKPALIEDPRLAEIIAEGELNIFSLHGSPAELENIVYSQLRGDTTLKLAWRQFGLYDINAAIQQQRFQRFQRMILILGVLGTGLVLIQNALENKVSASKVEILTQELEQRTQTALTATPSSTAPPPVAINATHFVEENLSLTDRFMRFLSDLMRYFIVVVPILISVLLAATNRFNSGVKWILLRSSAENIKREIYRYRARAEIYSTEQTQIVSRELKLANKLQVIGRQLMQTEVNMCALQSYRGTVPGYYADNTPLHSSAPRDDGLSIMTPQQYLGNRLEDQLQYFVKKANRLEKQLHRLQWAFYLIGGIGTLLAAIGLEVWIALTTSIVTALTTYMEYQQLEKDLSKKNQAAGDLFNVRTWWISLSPEEQSKQHNIDMLVGNTERIIQSEFTNWMQEMQDALDKLKEQQEDILEKEREKEREKNIDKNTVPSRSTPPRKILQTQYPLEEDADEKIVAVALKHDTSPDDDTPSNPPTRTDDVPPQSDKPT
jgi:hypothetical protein